MKTLVISLAVLFLAVRPVGQAAPPAPTASPDAETADLQAVVNGFLQMSQTHQPPLAWRRHLAHGGLTVYPGDAKTFRYSDFAPLQPYAQGPGPFYVVDVFAQGDAHQRPVYLYLLSKAGRHVRTVAALHVVNGQPQRIAG